MIGLATGLARRLFPLLLRGYLRRQPGQLPVNFRVRHSSNSAIDSDVAYAVRIGETYLDALAAEGIDPNGKTILELGPGFNFGTAFVLACHGARPIVADRFLASWDPVYHPGFYRALRETLAARGVPDLRPLDRLVERDGYDDGEIRRISRSAEDLRGISEAAVDIVLSNAVFEHLSSPLAASRELARVSKPLAWGFHQVDFRDHRDFERPLEYLLLDDEAFGRMFAERHGECGSQWRPWELTRSFTTSGFEVVHFEASMTATEEYLREFEPRLRNSASRYRNMPISELRTISGRFHLRRRLSGLNRKN